MSLSRSGYLFLLMSFVTLGINARFTVSMMEKFDNCSDFRNTGVFVTESWRDIDSLMRKESPLFRTIVLTQDLPQPLELKLKLERYTKGKHTFFYQKVYPDICKSLRSARFHWAVFLRAIGITQCPIKKGKYIFKEPMLDIQHVRVNYLNGVFRVTSTLMKGGETIVCIVSHFRLRTTND